MNGTRKRVADRDRFDEEGELVARFDRGEDILSEDDEIVEVTFKKPLDHVIPVRLASESWKALHREARELGVGPTTLARMWLLERLRAVEAGRQGSVAVREEAARYVVRAKKATAKKTTRPAASKKPSRRRTR